MYSYDKEKDMFVFSSDLTEYLLKHGISMEHINKMKEKKLEKSRGVYQKFPSKDSDENRYVDLVPLDKVIGTCRGTVGWSVYENVRAMYCSDREPGRFEGCLKFLDKMPLHELQKSYEELYSPVKMTYYVDDDEYYLSGDGNHRTLTAMLVEAKYIRAEVTNGYCDVAKKEKYLLSEAFKVKYGIVNIMSADNIYDISFKDDNGVYEICGYIGPQNNENLRTFLIRISATIEADIHRVNNIKKMPAIIQKLIFYYGKNGRIKQYINKKYLNEEECIFWMRRYPVILYDL